MESLTRGFMSSGILERSTASVVAVLYRPLLMAGASVCEPQPPTHTAEINWSTIQDYVLTYARHRFIPY
jgi:hypothetical protein